MKNIIVLLLLIILVLQSSGQTRNSLAKEDYLIKSKNQKTAAWVMLIGGALTTTIGVAVGVGGAVDQAFGSPGADKGQTLASILAISGSAAVLGSIPLFIAAGKNKKKAMSLSFGGQPIPGLSKTALVYKTVPSITLKIGL